MFTTEITVNHTDGDRVSYNRPYNMPQTFETVELAVDFKKRFVTWYGDLKSKGKLRDINEMFQVPTHIDGIYDTIISIKVVLVEDFCEPV